MTSRMSDERLDGEIRASRLACGRRVGRAAGNRGRDAHRPRSEFADVRRPARLPAGRGPAIVVALLALLAVLFATAAILGSRLLIVPDRDSWLPAGTTIEPRHDHTATALPNGTVLVAGGLLGEHLQVTELFDPVTLSWTRTGDLSQQHGWTTATVLADGRVLLAGVTRAEVYDPRTGSWIRTGPMIEERYGHTATLLPDERVLIAGGVHVPADGSEGVALASAEVFDPATGTWEETGAMDDARHRHTATLLRNGLVLVAGGIADSPPDGSAERLTSAELYDPATGTWTDTGPMHTRRALHTGTLLSSGLVLIAGGNRAEHKPLGKALASAELYDPAIGAWTDTGQLEVGRAWHTATALGDGTVLVTGGSIYRGAEALASTERYDPATGQWTAGPPMEHARYDHTATLMSDGSVLIVGGVADMRWVEVTESDGSTHSELTPAGELDLLSAEIYRP